MDRFPSDSEKQCALIGSTDSAASDRKNISFESAMVNVGSLVTYLAAAAVKRTAFLLKKAAVKAVNGAGPFGRGLKNSAAKRIDAVRGTALGFKERLAESKRKFSERTAEAGFGRALVLQLSDMADAARNSRKFAASVVNYAVPVVCVAFLVCVVADKTSADYVVAVEYNGQELGIVSEEAVLNNAQEVISERATYYDTNSDTYITATLSLKPLGIQDEVIDEQTLADAIQEQIDIQNPAEDVLPEESENGIHADFTASEENTDMGEVPNEEEKNDDEINLYGGNVSAAIGNDTNDRERAFVVTVDGEVIGAVKANDEITNFLEEKKEEYLTDDIVEVSFDKDIEYTYEQYVDPEEIVNQDEIIGKLDSIVSEPLYYEVREGDNPWSIARSNGMTTEELIDCNITFKGEKIDDLTQYCPIGAIVQLSEEVPYLQVLTTREVEYTESIDYEIVKTKDPDMYKGDSEVDVPGVEGEKKVRAMVTYRGDVPVSTEIVDEIVISEPVTKYMRVGTRETTTPVSTGTGGSGSYFWPVDGGYISAYQGDGRGHKGIDIAAPYGTPIYAAESGTVIETGDGWNGGYGNCVRVQHDDGNVTVYAHQSSIAVSYGDYVVKGQLLGYVGSTGDSTGNHLHFEVRSYGTYANPLDYVSQN
ncbi:MAG: peptidoglycan DD-metalloendopeptidase family protein [Oscillospiraceae bacterium]|nr:peptidoglycan DD-metalloendopeptidase family protein [Oscillospiraceae bacterium]